MTKRGKRERHGAIPAIAESDSAKREDCLTAFVLPAVGARSGCSIHRQFRAEAGSEWDESPVRALWGVASPALKATIAGIIAFSILRVLALLLCN